MPPKHAQILSGLSDLRETAPGLAELAASVGLGVLAAGCLGLLFSLFRRRIHISRTAALVEKARDLPEPDRVALLAKALRDLTERMVPGDTDWSVRAVDRFGIDPDLMNTLSASLYAPGPLPDLDRLEQAVLLAARKVRA